MTGWPIFGDSSVIDVISPASANVTPRSVSIEFPPDTMPFAGWISPDGNRLVWTLLRAYSTPPIFDGIFRLLGMRDRVTEELWTSQLNGQGMHEVGFIDCNENDHSYSDSIRWTPDGKKLSFIYKDELWTIPVE